MAESYYLGTPVWFETTFTDRETEVVGDPATVTVDVWEEGDATATRYTYGVDAAVIRQAAGVYRIKTTPSRPGRVYAYWRGAGAIDAAVLLYAIVLDDRVPE